MMTSVALAQTARRAGVALLLLTALAGNASRSYGQSGEAMEPEAAPPGATGGEEMALHAAVPPLAASPIHPLFGWTLSLAGVVGLAGDERPTVWVRATSENGRTTLYTADQLESLGYQILSRRTDEVVLAYGPIRLVIRDHGTM